MQTNKIHKLTKICAISKGTFLSTTFNGSIDIITIWIRSAFNVPYYVGMVVPFLIIYIYNWWCLPSYFFLSYKNVYSIIERMLNLRMIKAKNLLFANSLLYLQHCQYFLVLDGVLDCLLLKIFILIRQYETCLLHCL